MNLNVSLLVFFLLAMAFQIAIPPILSEKVKNPLSVHFDTNSVLHWREGLFLLQPRRGVAAWLSKPQQHLFLGHGVALLPGRLAETQPRSVHIPPCAGERARSWQPSGLRSRCQLRTCSQGGEPSPNPSTGNTSLDGYFSVGGCIFIYMCTCVVWGAL